ncbi:uncharacterized protein LOC135703377 [Ochlerotatus camptorhynchus]|uniref:uncharacterized protein LOC135703377 n=1 Tax=Ochlerotatus camptorhynchus TaxID=644619 RepID=UPI0031E26BE5
MIHKLVLVAALVCLVAADVSEVLRRSHGRVAVIPARYGTQLKTNGHKLKTRQTESEEAHQFDTIFIEDPVNHDFQAFDVEESDEPAKFQLHQSHPDYKGPYHYEKPKLNNGYLAPIVTTYRPNDDYLAPIITTHRPLSDQLAPIITTHKPSFDDYLPPHGPRDDFAENVAKRSIKLRRRV